MMIGTCLVVGRERRIRHTSNPERTGRFRSRMIRCGCCSATALSAASPLLTIVTTVSGSRSSVCLIRPAMSCSSSTTRMRVGGRREALGGPGRGGGALRMSQRHAVLLGSRQSAARPCGHAPVTLRRWSFPCCVACVKCGLRTHRVSCVRALPHPATPNSTAEVRPEAAMAFASGKVVYGGVTLGMRRER